MALLYLLLALTLKVFGIVSIFKHQYQANLTKLITFYTFFSDIFGKLEVN